MNLLYQIALVLFKIRIKLKSKKYYYKCNCGNTIKIAVNKYDNSNSGMAYCNCGAILTIN